MAPPDLEGARGYALGRLACELPASLVYHSLAHTRDEVVPAVERLAALSRVGAAGLLLLRTAAYYHDLGFVVQRHDHELASAQIAGAVLPGFGYGPRQIARIVGMIYATRLPQRPRGLLEQIMADADLDLLGRDDFLARNEDLRRELAAGGEATNDVAWLADQLRFLAGHRYWTAAARALRDRGKAANREALGALLARATA
ncbi:MAG TPA: phosphohydrolase [Chloroflexaceae bacterium]|nr:phosphohydrolase [Chloroflexaceae bacterium]